MATLEQRLYYELTADTRGHDLDEFADWACAHHTHSDDDSLDMRDAGFAYGLALGMALAESPRQQAREQAIEAAEEAWRRWISVPTRRDIRELEEVA
jgi:hypothetical protein